ncbi:MAG: hypothetical protein AAFW66_04105 [Pseudomonadota bacterium]
MARPKKQDHERRSEQVFIRVTPAEREHIINEANRLNMTMTAYVREMALSGRVTVQKGQGLAPETYIAFQRAATNLHQLLKVERGFRGIGPTTSLEDTLARLNGLLDEGLCHDRPRQ